MSRARDLADRVLHNRTHEDTEGGRESIVTFKGEQSGGEISTLAQIQASHDGTADDQKADLIFKTNDGSDNAAPTERMRIDSVGTVTITNASNDSQLILESTDADANSGPVLDLYRNSASPADDDALGFINFYGENDADEKTLYGQIRASIKDASDGTEDARFIIQTAVGGTQETSRLEMTGTETVINEDSKDLDFRIESDGEANMFHVDGAANSIGIGETGLAAFSSAWGTVDTTRQLSIKGSAYGVLHLKNSGTPSHYTMGVGDGSLYGAYDAVGGKHHVRYTSNTETVFNDDSNDLDFRVESAGNANIIGVDAGNNVIGFGKFGSTGGTTTEGAYFADSSFFHFALTTETTTAGLSAQYINRQNSDGVLIEFRQADTMEGTIAVSGSTVSYNGFSGRHESSGIPTNTPVGTVVSTIDELDVYPDTTTDMDGNTITHKKAGQTRADHAKVEISNSEGDACVYGVVSEFDGDGKVIVTSVGIGSIRVTGACAKGDLLESNGDGTAKVQSDDIIRSKTIGKVTIGNSNTGVKLVSCVMYCG